MPRRLRNPKGRNMVEFDGLEVVFLHAEHRMPFFDGCDEDDLAERWRRFGAPVVASAEPGRRPWPLDVFGEPEEMR